MSKKTKKQERAEAKKLKGRQFNQAVEKGKQDRIDQSVTSFVDDKYSISFRFYNDNFCEIEFLEGENSQKIIKLFRSVGESRNQNELKSIFSKNQLEHKVVNNDKEYKKLYKNFPAKGATIYEVILGTIPRLFYTIVENKFCVISILSKTHLKTDKQ